MKQLSVKGITEESYASWRRDAFDSHKSFRDWVIMALNAYVKLGKPIEPTKELLEKALKLLEPKDSRSSSEVLAEAQKRLEERKKLEPPVVPSINRALSHNAKTCRLYGCGICKSEGHADKVRGL